MSKCSKLVPTGISDLKYSPFIPLHLHIMSTVSHSFFCLGCFPSPTSISYYISLFLLLSLLLTSCLSLPLSVLFYSSLCLLLHLSIPLSHFVSVSRYIDRSLYLSFCIHMFEHRQMTAILECMCSRSGADCATAKMNF